MADPQARNTLHPDFRCGTVDRRLFGSFVEHLGRAVYTGIYEPGHATADAHGFRKDVAELTHELGVSMVR
jgi:alpha-N-arabinofuranosidase